MGYEESCNEFALYGCPMREHYDYEENARYDQFDGYHEDMLLMEQQIDQAPCFDCADNMVCYGCVESSAKALKVEQQYHQNRQWSDDTPF